MGRPNQSSPLMHTDDMGAEGALPPKQVKRKRSLTEQVPGSEPGTKRVAGKPPATH